MSYVFTHLLGIRWPRPEALRRVARQQSFQESDRLPGQVFGVGELRAPNLLKELLPVAAIERRQACEHFVQESAQGPPVHLQFK